MAMDFRVCNNGNIIYEGQGLPEASFHITMPLSNDVIENLDMQEKYADLNLVGRFTFKAPLNDAISTEAVNEIYSALNSVISNETEYKIELYVQKTEQENIIPYAKVGLPMTKIVELVNRIAVDNTNSFGSTLQFFFA